MSARRPAPAVTPALAPVALVLVALLALAYLPGLPAAFGEGDVAKFQFVGPALGTPHPTGYPLHTLLSHGFARLLPGATWAYAGNLFAALLSMAAAVAVALGAAVGLGVRRGAALGAGLLFGLAPDVRQAARVAEVYPLHALLVACALGAMLAYARHGRGRALVVATLVSGLALANHATAVLLAPALAAVAGSRHGGRAGGRPGSRVAWVAVVTAAALLALAPYVYLVERSYAASAPYLEARASSLAQLADTLAGAQFRGNLGELGARALLGERLPWIARRSLAGGALLLPLGLAGLLWLERSARRALALFLLGSLGFLLAYTVPDLESYLLAPAAALAIAAAVPLDALARRLEARLGRRAAPAFAALVACVPALLLFEGGEPAAAAGERETRTRAALAAAPDPSAIVVLGYARGMAFEASRLGGAPGGARGVLVLPAEAVGSRFLLGPVLRHLEGAAPLRLPPHDRPLAPGAPLLLAGADAPDLARLAATGIDATPVAGTGLYRLRAAPGASPPPLAFVASALEPVADLRGAAARLLAADFDPLAVALVAGAGAPRRASGGAVASIEVGADRIAVELVPGAAGWLVVQETLRDRWLAVVDGVETPTFRADWSYPALALPAAARRVELVRDARPFTLARWLRSPWGHLVP